MIGVDYAFLPHPPVSALKAAGVQFVCRYASGRPEKDITLSEANALRNAGIDIVLVYETTAGWMLTAGEAGGVDAATTADEIAKACGVGGVPIYFADDNNSTAAEQPLIDATLRGCAAKIGPARVGLYGFVTAVSLAFDHGTARFGWLTGPGLDPRVHIRQFGSFLLAGASCDHDVALKPDFGQFPRPASHSPYRHVASGHQSLDEIAAARHTTPAHILGVTAAHYTAGDLADAGKLALPAGFPYYTTN